MPEEIKQAVEETAKAIKKVPTDKIEMATRFAETFATGLATGIALSAADSAEGKDNSHGRK